MPLVQPPAAIKAPSCVPALHHGTFSQRASHLAPNQEVFHGALSFVADTCLRRATTRQFLKICRLLILQHLCECASRHRACISRCVVEVDNGCVRPYRCIRVAGFSFDRRFARELQRQASLVEIRDAASVHHWTVSQHVATELCGGALAGGGALECETTARMAPSQARAILS